MLPGNMGLVRQFLEDQALGRRLPAGTFQDVFIKKQKSIKHA